jgi:hypothetical protein
MSDTPWLGMSYPSGSNRVAILNADIDILDGHDHTGVGSGKKITHAALDIGGDVSFGGGAVADVKFVKLDPQSSPVTSSFALYTKPDGNLFYQDNASNEVQVTLGGALNVNVTASFNFIPQTDATSFTILSSNTSNLFEIGGFLPVTGTLPLASDVDLGRFYDFNDATGTASRSRVLIMPTGADTINGLAGGFSVFGSTKLKRNFAGTGWISDHTPFVKRVNSFTGSLNSPGPLVAQSDLYVAGTAGLSGTLTVAGLTTFNSTAPVEFNTGIGVDGTAVFNGLLNVSGNIVTAGNTTFGDAAADVTTVRRFEAVNNVGIQGSTVLAGLLNVSGTVTSPSISSQISVAKFEAQGAVLTGSNTYSGANTYSGVQTFNNNVEFNSGFGVDGTTVFNGLMFVTGNVVTVGNTTFGDTNADVTTVRRLEVEANLGIDGTTNVNGLLFVSGSSVFAGTATYNSTAPVEFNTGIGVDGTAVFNGLLNVSGASTLAGQLTLNSTLPTEFNGPIGVDGTAVFNGNLNVSGNVTLGDASSDVISSVGRHYFTNGSFVSGSQVVSGIARGLDVASNAVIRGDLFVSGNMYVGIPGTSTAAYHFITGTIYDVAGTFSHTYNTRARYGIVPIYGGGGGGGGVNGAPVANTAGGGGGGGGGNYVKLGFVIPTAVTGTTLIVASGGTAGVGSTNTSGGDGGTSSFFTPSGQRSATGGGGAVSPSANTGVVSSPGNDSNSIGAINIDVIEYARGGTGDAGWSIGATGIAVGGRGGSCPNGFGGGSVVASSGATSVAGDSPPGFGGGGGGGATIANSDPNGGSGGGGFIVVFEYS